MRVDRGKGAAYLLLVVQALVVVVERGQALALGVGAVDVAVGHIAGEDFLPEGEAAGRACRDELVRMRSRSGDSIEP